MLAFFFVLCLVVYYASYSVALSQGEPFEDLSDTFTLTQKKKDLSASQETNDDVAHDKTPTPPPSASSSGVYLEDM